MGRIKDDEEKSVYTHFTHDHPLELVNFSQAASVTTCSGCNREIVPGKEFFICKICSFSLHRACFNMTRLYHHPAERDHELTLLLLPSFQCKACGLLGSGFCYNCRICACNYHSLCLRMPLKESCDAHEHPLILEVSDPYDRKGFKCDVCGDIGFDHWLYRCNECEFDVHLNCIYAPVAPVSPRFLSPTGTDNNYVPAIFPTVDPSIGTSSNTRALAMSSNNINILARAPPGATGTAYMNSNPSTPDANLSSQTGSHVSNPGTFTQTGVNDQNLTGGSGAQAMLGSGTARVLATGFISGIAEGTGQEIIDGLFNASDQSS